MSDIVDHNLLSDLHRLTGKFALTRLPLLTEYHLLLLTIYRPLLPVQTCHTFPDTDLFEPCKIPHTQSGLKFESNQSLIHMAAVMVTHWMRAIRLMTHWQMARVRHLVKARDYQMRKAIRMQMVTGTDWQNLMVKC